MAHNILFCKIHKQFFHGLRPTGPHFNSEEHHALGHYSYVSGLNDGTLVDIGLCPCFYGYSIQATKMHEWYLDRWNAEIAMTLKKMGLLK